MFNRIRDWFLRAAAESAIDRAERANKFENLEGGLFTPDFEDRRRLAVAELFMVAERQDGKVMPAEYGQVILHHVVDESEVMDMGDKTTRTVNRRIARGQLG